MKFCKQNQQCLLTPICVNWVIIGPQNGALSVQYQTNTDQYWLPIDPQKQIARKFKPKYLILENVLGDVPAKCFVSASMC